MENQINITSERARNLLATFYGFQNGTLSEDKAGLSLEQFNKLLQILARNWQLNSTEELLKELERIASSGIEETAVIPTNLKELVENYERWEELRKLAQKNPQVQTSLKIQGKQLVEAIAQIEQTTQSVPPLEKVPSTTDTSPSDTVGYIKSVARAPETDSDQVGQKEAEVTVKEWIQEQREERIYQTLSQIGLKHEARAAAQEIVDTSGIDPGPEQTELIASYVFDFATAHGLNDAEKELIVDHVIAIVNPQLIAQEARQLPSLKTRTSFARDEIPSTGSTSSPQAGSGQAEKEEEREIYLAILRGRPASYTSRLAGQFGTFFGDKKETDIEQLKSALLRLQIEHPKLFAKHALPVRILQGQLEALIKENEAIEQAEFVEKERITERTQNWSMANTQLVRAIFNNRQGFASFKEIPFRDFLQRINFPEQQFSTFTQETFTQPYSSRYFSTQTWYQFENIAGRFLNRGAGLAEEKLATSRILPRLTNFMGGMLRQGGMMAARALAGLGGAAAGAALPVGAIIAGVLVVVVVLAFIVINTSQSSLLKVGGLVSSESPFIGVSKSAKPASEFENNTIPDRITYTITVRAKQKKLSSLTITDTTQVSGKNANKTLDNQSWPVPEITSTWSQDVVLETASIKNDLIDSLLTNHVVVKGNVEGESGQHTSSTTYVIRIGNPPEDCPSGWPVGSGYINQGPDGSATHKGDEAIDIHNLTGTPIRATHTGTAYPFTDQYGGLDIEIHGTCGQKAFKSLFAHFSSVGVKSGQLVRKGDYLGAMGCTGYCSSPHLHYQFRGLPMAPIYIPTTVPRGCVGSTVCNVRW